jgi:hypothetical protein
VRQGRAEEAGEAGGGKPIFSLKNFSLSPYLPISLYIFTIKYKNHTLVR